MELQGLGALSRDQPALSGTTLAGRIRILSGKAGWRSIAGIFETPHKGAMDHQLFGHSDALAFCDFFAWVKTRSRSSEAAFLLCDFVFLDERLLFIRTLEGERAPVVYSPMITGVVRALF